MLVGVTKGGALPAAKGVIRDRHRDRHVDADHADIHLRRKLARRAAVRGEDRATVPVLMIRGIAGGFLERLSTHDLQHRPEDFLMIGFHAGLHMIEQRRADEEALLVALQRMTPTIQDEPGAFVDTHLDIAFNLRLVHGGDDRPVMRILVGRDADLQLLRLGCHPLDELIGRLLAHRHGHRQRHAAFAGRAIGCADDVFHRLLHVGVRQDDTVVLRAAHRLHALSVGGARRINVLCNIGRSDEADSLDVRVREDGVDGNLVAIDDVQHTRRGAGLEHQLGETHGN